MRPMHIYIMPHSKDEVPQFKTIGNFIHYLKHGLPEDNEYIYRHQQACHPGLFIAAFERLILGEFETWKRDDIDPSLNPDYKYEYHVKSNSIRIYQTPVLFNDLRKRISLKATSPNRRPKLTEEQYHILLEMANSQF